MMIKLKNCGDAELLIASIELIKTSCKNLTRMDIRDWNDETKQFEKSFEYDNAASKYDELIKKIEAITKSGDYPVVIMMDEI